MATTLEVYTRFSASAQKEAVALLEQQVFPSVFKLEVKKRRMSNLRAISSLNGGADETRTRDLLRDRQAF
jgi:hypothetical protein